MNPDTIILSSALLILAGIMVAGLMKIRSTIKASNSRLLPMYAADVEAAKTVASNSNMIAENIAKRLAHVTDSLTKLQMIVETELKKKRPILMTS